MKKIILCIYIFFCFYQLLLAQSINSEVKIKELAVPQAPAFKLLDISPTQIESPTTPKQFALGVAQSFNDSIGWPQNYSMEFAPYWWLKSANRSVYDFLGLKTELGTNNEKSIIGENIFSGLKFTSVSLAFINQDLIPDEITQAQKIFSAGIHSTIIKIHSKNYGKSLEKELKKWHDAASNEIKRAEAGQPPNEPKDVYDAYWQKFTDLKPTSTSEIFDKINDIINEKPLFSIDLSAAYATYGINDSVWQTGRTGLWSTISLNLPLKLGDNSINSKYVSLFGYLRYLEDNYAMDKNNLILKSSSFDVGGKIAFQFDEFSIGYEIIHRNYSKDNMGTYDRKVGVISYQLGNNLYLNGAFGKDFGISNKLISFLGINWGFGNEKIKLD